MMEERVEAGEVSVEGERGIEQELEVKVVEVGSECDEKEGGCNDVVANGEDEAGNSYVLVSGSDVMVEDTVERGNVSEVSVEVSDGEVVGESGFKDDEFEGFDGGQKAENEEDGRTTCAAENGVSLLSKDAEESHMKESNQDEIKTDIVEESEIVDEEAEQGEVGNACVGETVEVEYSLKLEDVQETVNVAPNDHDSKLQQIISSGAVQNGDTDIGISNLDVEEKLNSEIELIESNESAHATEELETENNEEYSLDKKENQDSEDMEELEKECNGEISLDKMENQESENLVPDDARVNLMELERAGHINLIDESLSGKKLIVNKEPYLSEEGHNLVIESEVSSDVKENEKCENFVPVDVLDFNRKEKNNLANRLPVECNAEFANTVIPTEHVDIQSSKISSVNVNDNDGNTIDSDANSGQLEKSEAASAISTGQEEKGLDYEAQVEVNDNNTAEAEQTMSKDILLNSVDQEKKELAGEINDGQLSHPGTDCASGHSFDRNDHHLVNDVEVIEPDTDAGDSNGSTDNEWPALSYYNTRKNINTESKSEILRSQEFEIRESEMYLADGDRKEVHDGSPVDDNLNGHKKEIVDASRSEDIEKAKEINHTVPSTAWADDNDQTDGVSSPSVLSTSSCSHSISDGIAIAANLENDFATSESGSKDDETNLNGTIEASKVETSSSEDSSLALVESEVDRRPFFFLIKVPRFEDDEIREQIIFAQQDVNEKTKLRDSYKVLIQNKKEICLGFNDEFEAAKLKEKAARDNLKAKRKEIDAAQAVIDKVNNAMTVEDIDGSIHIMEHRMQHETVPLSEEKQLMREIKRLKHFKEQLSSSIGTQEELQEALDQKDQIKDHLKSLKRELNSIRSEVQRAEIVTKAAKKKCFDEYAELNKMQLEFKAADGVRQEAYISLVSLRRELAQKNKFFRMYKDNEKLANDYALSGDKKSLHSLCVNQVETVMELWNTNDQFQNDYIKCNARSTLRRLKTLDGRSLGLNEEPPSLPYIRNDRINHSEVETTNSLSQFPPPEESKIHVPCVAEKVVNEPVMDVLEKKAAKKQSNSTTAASEVSTVPSLELTPLAKQEVEQTKEEEVLAKKAEEIRKREEEAKMMEQLQLEERAKAKEALERKKRMAEKAQARANIRAKKEAEQREKEREKRLRKKEKRKDAKEDGIAVNEAQAEATKEANPVEKPAPVSKRHHKPSHYVKSTKTSTMPLNLRNRNRRKMQMWMWSVVAALTAVALVVLWFGYLSYLEERERLGH